MKKILFLGGAFSQIPILKKAKEKGVYIIVCDYLPNNPGRLIADEYYSISTTDFDAVMELCKEVEPVGIVAYASDPAAPVASFVSEKLNLPGNSYKSVQILSEKDRFREFLRLNGFNSPQSISLQETEIDLTRIQGLNFPLIVKPVDSSGSKGVSRINSSNEFYESCHYALKFSRLKRIVVEELIESDGPQLHGDGFVLNGRLAFCYLGDHHYDVDVNPFVPYSTTWPTSKNAEIRKKVELEVDRLIQKVGFLNGPINIEARINREGKVFIMEIGPRSGGNFVPQVIENATGFDMVEATLDLVLNNNVQIKTRAEGCAAYYVIHSHHDGILKNIEIDENLKHNTIDYIQYIKNGEKVISFQGANAAIGLLLLKFASVDEMNEVMSKITELVRLEIDNL